MKYNVTLGAQVKTTTKVTTNQSEEDMRKEVEAQLIRFLGRAGIEVLEISTFVEEVKDDDVATEGDAGSQGESVPYQDDEPSTDRG